jgi:hypothetical protein
MCRNIRTLHNFAPPATQEEVRAAALQYVRKISGYRAPSVADTEAFAEAVDAISEVSELLLERLVARGEPRDREAEATKARAERAKSVARQEAKLLARHGVEVAT